MPLIRTPEERFDQLPGYPFAPHYVTINDARVHYVDEGQGAIILCLHGEPSWSYLYRKMIPILAAQHRVIAPDLIGFGKSDKYTEMEAYSIPMHLNMLREFILQLDLSAITLVVQDWGGLLGLQIAATIPERFARLVIMNTGMPAGVEPMPEAFLQWQGFAKSHPDLPVGMVIRSGLVNGRRYPKEIIDAYEAPFPDETYKAGAAVFPSLVPVSPDDPGAAEMLDARERLKKWDKPVLVMFSDQDPITKHGDKFFRSLIPTAKDQPEIVIRDAGHFLQEDKGEEIAQHILDFMERTR